MSLRPNGYAEAVARERARRVRKATRNPQKPKARATIGKGRLTLEWDAVRAKLKPLFLAAGITTCELHYPMCWRDNGLGFAHTKRRRNLLPGELEIVILVCNSCHEKLDCRDPAETKRIVMATIDARLVAV